MFETGDHGIEFLLDLQVNLKGSGSVARVLQFRLKFKPTWNNFNRNPGHFLNDYEMTANIYYVIIANQELCCLT